MAANTDSSRTKTYGKASISRELSVREALPEDVIKNSADISTKATQKAEMAMNQLVVAEMFLVQATIESASALSEGLREIRQKPSALGEVVKSTRKQILEPYRVRLQDFRNIRKAVRSSS